ncbi:MAG: biotin--[acetyl-CoA-carboxylase] ligase [Lachnospiraceae bacterium]|nr:biotin--[acetyl-CoA-carboxylase] ligase [Lachnospiraceae bacterium]
MNPKTKILKKLRETKGFVSGQSLCEELEVSRTAVWKNINQLKEEGYEIESVTNRGYHLNRIPDVLTKEELESIMLTDKLARNIVYREVVGSTNNEAKKYVEQHPAANGQESWDGTLFIAEQQNEGKGRRGRNWISPKGSGIWMSLLLKPDINPANASMLTLVSAMAIARGIQKTVAEKSLQEESQDTDRDHAHSVEDEMQIGIKWPNDIVVNGRKVCGILTEMGSEMDYINYVVVGMGINVNTEDFPQEVKEIATSLRLETGEHIKRSELVAEIMFYYEAYYRKFLKTEDLSLLIDEYNELLINAGREVRVIEQDTETVGIAGGIDKEGCLLVKCGEQTRKIRSGEVSVRGLYGYV